MKLVLLSSGRVAKRLERLTAVRNIDGSSRTLGSYLGCSLTVHPAANWCLVATLGKLKAARKGTGHPTSTMPMAQDKCHSNRHSPNVRNRTRDSPLPFVIMIFSLCCRINLLSKINTTGRVASQHKLGGY